MADVRPVAENVVEDQIIMLRSPWDERRTFPECKMSKPNELGRHFSPPAVSTRSEMSFSRRRRRPVVSLKHIGPTCNCAWKTDCRSSQKRQSMPPRCVYGFVWKLCIVQSFQRPAPTMFWSFGGVIFVNDFWTRKRVPKRYQRYSFRCFLLSVSPKAFSFRNRSLLTFAYRLVTIFSTIAACRILKLS